MGQDDRFGIARHLTRWIPGDGGDGLLGANVQGGAHALEGISGRRRGGRQAGKPIMGCAEWKELGRALAGRGAHGTGLAGREGRGPG